MKLPMTAFTWPCVRAWVLKGGCDWPRLRRKEPLKGMKYTPLILLRALPVDYHTKNSTEPTYHRPERSLSLSNFLATVHIRGAMFPG